MHILDSLDKSFVEMFSDLKWAAEADDFLKKIQDGTSIALQLNLRKVVRVTILPLISNGGLCIEAGGFEIYLNDSCGREDNIFTFAHELAHTFHYDVSVWPPRRLEPEDLSDERYDLIEEFCNAFALRWVFANWIGKNCLENLENLMFLQTEDRPV